MNAIGVPPIAFWRVTQPSAHFGGRHRISGRSCLRHDIVQGQEVERAFGAGDARRGRDDARVGERGVRSTLLTPVRCCLSAVSDSRRQRR